MSVVRTDAYFGGTMTENGLQSVLLIRLEEIYSASKWGRWMEIESVFDQFGCWGYVRVRVRVRALVPQPLKAFLCTACLSEP